MRTILIHLNVSTLDETRTAEEIVEGILRHLGPDPRDVLAGRDEFHFDNGTTVDVPLWEETT